MRQLIPSAIILLLIGVVLTALPGSFGQVPTGAGASPSAAARHLEVRFAKEGP